MIDFQIAPRESFKNILIKKIILDSDFRHDTGIEMEKMRLAMDKERERLSQTHKYEDNTSDQPFLTPETVEG
jgi:hypothetical protein